MLFYSTVRSGFALESNKRSYHEEPMTEKALSQMIGLVGTERDLQP